MVFFFATIRIWAKTMDYSKAFEQFSFRNHNSSLEGVTELKLAPFSSS